MKFIKRILLLILALIPCVCFAGGINVSKTSINMYVGDTASFTVTPNEAYVVVTPSINGTSASSSINSKFDVDSMSGESKTFTITGRSVGTTTIVLNCTVATYDTEQEFDTTKTITINVTERPVQPTQPAPITQPTTKKTTTTTTTQLVTEAPTEVPTEPTTEVKGAEDINPVTNIKVVGYDIKFDKGTKEYTININKDVTELYIIVEGENLTSPNPGVVDIVNKDSIELEITYEGGSQKYVINLNKKSITNDDEINKLKNHNKTLFIIIVIMAILFLLVCGLTFYFLYFRKNDIPSNQVQPIQNITNEVSTDQIEQSQNTTNDQNN